MSTSTKSNRDAKPKKKKKCPTTAIGFQLHTERLAQERDESRREKEEHESRQFLKSQQKLLGKKKTEEFAHIRLIRPQDRVTRQRNNLHQNGKPTSPKAHPVAKEINNDKQEQLRPTRMARPLLSARERVAAKDPSATTQRRLRPQSAKPVLQASVRSSEIVSGTKISVRRLENCGYNPVPLTTSSSLLAASQSTAQLRMPRNDLHNKTSDPNQDRYRMPTSPLVATGAIDTSADASTSTNGKQRIVVYMRRLELSDSDDDGAVTDPAAVQPRRSAWMDAAFEQLRQGDTPRTAGERHELSAFRASLLPAICPPSIFPRLVHFAIRPSAGTPLKASEHEKNMSEQVSSSARRIEALTRHLAVTPLAVSTKEKVMAELTQERARASFPVRKMTHFIDGGAHRTKFREEMMEYLEAYPELRTAPGDYDLTLQQRRVATLTKVRRLYQLFIEHGANMDKRNIMAEIAGIYDLGVWVRNGVHFGLFVGAIGSQADKEQQDEWMTAALLLEIFGSFAMTELGHGSFTRGFETTAVFDHATDEFVIHTPTDTATKWWIGAAGETATHTVCFAQLMIDGKSKGVQSFLVPLRDPQSHEPLPGIRIGDIGSKMGLQGVDNGWIQFDHVRVPRFNMLRRYASVTREGQFIQTHKAQMAYAALIGTRGKLVTLSNGILKKALTIAVRYCAIRRQGVQVNSKDAHEETKLLDYQSHQYRLMPLLAKAYAYHFQTSHIEALIEKFDSEGGDIATDLLADIHGTMAGLKAFCSWDTLAGIEECRQCCGGSGYSSYNGLSNLLADFSVIVTFEGDNTVMALQTANYLIRSVEALKNHQKLAGSVQYLERVSSNQTQKRWNVHSAQDLANPENLIDALTVFAGKQVFAAAEKHAKASAAFSNPQEAWNHCHVDLLEIARVHVFYSIAAQFLHEVQEIKNSSTKSDLATPLETLCLLYVLHEFDRSAAFFLKEQYMTATQCELIHEQVVLACGRVRLDAVPLVDTFNLSDLVLNSSIGQADGNIYEHMLGVASKKTGISPYFASHIKPMLEGEQLE